jgi:hypothetical protein
MNLCADMVLTLIDPETALNLEETIAIAIAIAGFEAWNLAPIEMPKSTNWNIATVFHNFTNPSDTLFEAKKACEFWRRRPISVSSNFKTCNQGAAFELDNQLVLILGAKVRCALIPLVIPQGSASRTIQTCCVYTVGPAHTLFVVFRSKCHKKPGANQQRIRMDVYGNGTYPSQVVCWALTAQSCAEYVGAQTSSLELQTRSFSGRKEGSIEMPAPHLPKAQCLTAAIRTFVASITVSFATPHRAHKRTRKSDLSVHSGSHNTEYKRWTKVSAPYLPP